MNNATRVTVATFGVVTGLAGLEHGIGEALQGNRAPDGLMILSWPESDLFRVLAGEPAMAVIPNLLVTGILTILVSLVFIVWATMFVQRKHGALVLMLLSIAMLLVGGGLNPPLIGLILGLAATRSNAPLTWWRSHLSPGVRHSLSTMWPWAFGAGLIAWLMLMPGTIILDYVMGVTPPDLVIYALAFSAFGLLLMTIVTAFAHDAEQENTQPRGFAMAG